MLASEAVQSEARRRAIEETTSKLRDAEAAASKTLSEAGSAVPEASPRVALDNTPATPTQTSRVGKWLVTAAMAGAAIVAAAALLVAHLGPQPTASISPQAQYEMGNNYFYGFGGVPKPDEQLAADWYRKAADQGFSDAQFRLGYLNEHGYGVIMDYGLAKYWYQKANDQGNEAAKASLARLNGK